jgi:hypothetical protein
LLIAFRRRKIKSRKNGFVPELLKRCLVVGMGRSVYWRRLNLFLVKIVECVGESEESAGSQVLGQNNDIGTGLLCYRGKSSTQQQDR